MPRLPFFQVDVFAEAPLTGNPLAVVMQAETLSTAQMQALAAWTNLSETVFLTAPADPAADYRLRIFTPRQELPFAGHPTLGAAFAWRAAGGRPKGNRIVQACGAGLIDIREEDGRFAFRAPPLTRSGPVEAALRTRLLAAVGLKPDDIEDMAHVENGPDWKAALLRDGVDLHAVRPDFAALDGARLGLAARTGEREPAFELRAFTAAGTEDPVTGSLQAGVAQWLVESGRASGRWVAAQGRAMGRDGRVHLVQDGADIWVGGRVIAVISGEISI